MFGWNRASKELQGDYLEMLDNTSKLIAKKQAQQLSTVANAYSASSATTDSVEFFKWLQRNYKASGIFESNVTMRNYMNQGAGNAQWMRKTVQGKSYEFLWEKWQRGNVRNILNTYDAGDVANRMGSDITERNLITGKIKEYQMKAYTSKTKPHLKNTPKDMAVVTNSEKVRAVSKMGYSDVQEFKSAEEIVQSTDKQMKKIQNGKAYSNYNIHNVAGTMAKAGAVGCIIGVGAEALALYGSWKNGELKDNQYLEELAKAGGDAGITSALTSGLMIPVSATITAAGVTTLLNFPIAFVLGSSVNKIVAPCFGRGKYREILLKARYYQIMDDAYDDMIEAIEKTTSYYCEFIDKMTAQQQTYGEIKDRSRSDNNKLKNLYDSI